MFSKFFPFFYSLILSLSPIQPSIPEYHMTDDSVPSDSSGRSGSSVRLESSTRLNYSQSSISTEE